MRLLSSLLVVATLAAAGPAEFGQAELDAAMAQRKLKWKNQVELSLDAPDTFRIEPYSMGGAHITGGDLRGLMYGLLEAAEQIRDSGHFTKTIGNPAASLRGVRIVMTRGVGAGVRGILEFVFPHAGAESLQPGARGFFADRSALPACRSFCRARRRTMESISRWEFAAASPRRSWRMR